MDITVYLVSPLPPILPAYRSGKYTSFCRVFDVQRAWLVLHVFPFLGQPDAIDSEVFNEATGVGVRDSRASITYVRNEMVG